MNASMLTDAKKGDLNFRSGRWVGYRGIPLQAMIYFDTALSVSSITN
jgi:hypothetical protein